MSLKDIQSDIEALGKKHGIGTYVFVVKDPDSDLEAFGFGGPLSWVVGSCSQMERMAAKRQDEIGNEVEA